ncbi:MAG: hypothetical protein ACRCYY_14420 [Trueperaceae bacterium]
MSRPLLIQPGGGQRQQRSADAPDERELEDVLVQDVPPQLEPPAETRLASTRPRGSRQSEVAKTVGDKKAGKTQATEKEQTKEGIFSKEKGQSLTEKYPSQQGLERSKELGELDNLERAKYEQVLKKRSEEYERAQAQKLSSGHGRGHGSDVREHLQQQPDRQRQDKLLRDKKLQEELEEEKNLLRQMAQRGRDMLNKMFRGREDEKARIEREHREQKLKLERDYRQAQEQARKKYQEEQARVAKQRNVRSPHQRGSPRQSLEAMGRKLKLDTFLKDQQAALEKRYRDLRATLEKQRRDRLNKLEQASSHLALNRVRQRERVCVQERDRRVRLDKQRVERQRTEHHRREQTRQVKIEREHQERQHQERSRRETMERNYQTREHQDRERQDRHRHEERRRYDEDRARRR